MRVLIVALLMQSLATHAALSQEAVYLIRHGEKELSGPNPALTPRGRERAADWAKMFQHVGFDAILTSDARRARETGHIIGEALNLTQTALPAADIAGLVDTIEFDHDDHTVLVVGHAETIPGILRYFGVAEGLTIDQGEFANLFILIGPSSGQPELLRLKMP